MLIGYLLREIAKEGIETDFVQLAAKAIHGCVACYKCFENQDRRCAVKNDTANEYIEKMTAAQGIILESPSYFQDVTTEMKALIDRAGFVGLANGKMYKDKVEAQWDIPSRAITGGNPGINAMMGKSLVTLK